jgi:hypothetical protein
MRLGLFGLIVGMLVWIAGGTHVPNALEADLFFMALTRAIFGGVTLAFNYISFEPFVRRRWPQTIISWSRLLAGGYRDPLVGRDVLIGTGIGVAIALIQMFGSLLYQIVGIPAVRVATDPTVLLGARHLVGQLMFVVSDSLYKSLGILFLLFLGRMMLRKQWIAAGVVVIALAAINAANAINPFIGWPVNIAFFGVVVFTLMRFGLLTMAVALFISLFISQFPLTADWSVWYSGEMAFTVMTVMAFALFGLRTAQAGQALFKEECE